MVGSGFEPFHSQRAAPIRFLKTDLYREAGLSESIAEIPG
jgi:hypothetical protein